MMQPLPEQRVLDALARFLRRSSTAPAGGTGPFSVFRLGDKDAWRVDAGNHTLLVKPYRRLQDEADVQWEHDFLQRLAGTGFPAPRPVPAFDGCSWLRVGDRVWGALTFLPGRSMAWEPRPGMDAAGELLARYHAAVRGIAVSGQRPSAVPLQQLHDFVVWDDLEIALGDRERARQLTTMLEALPHELQAAEFDTLDALVVHGDCTADNIVIDGEPPAAVGTIDFGNAHVERWLADLGAALWRSGRAGPSETAQDVRRVCDFVLGYHRQTPLDARVVHTVPLLIKARGLQLFVRRMHRASTDQLPAQLPLLTETYERTCWARDHQHELEDALDDAFAAMP